MASVRSFLRTSKAAAAFGTCYRIMPCRKEGEMRSIFRAWWCGGAAYREADGEGWRGGAEGEVRSVKVCQRSLAISRVRRRKKEVGQEITAPARPPMLSFLSSHPSS